MHFPAVLAMIFGLVELGVNPSDLHHSNYLIPFNQSMKQSHDEIYTAILLPSVSNNLAFDAVKWALEIINNSSVILAKKKLKVVYTVTECKMPRATEQFLNLMNSSVKINIIFGCGCYELTGALSEISSYWNITQITYSDTDFTLSSKNKYPNLIRTVVSDYCFNFASIAMLKRFNWTRVGILYQDEVSYLRTSSNALVNAHLVHEMEKKGYKPYSFGFFNDPTKGLVNLKRLNVRIIMGIFQQRLNEEVLCKAYTEGLIGRNYVWIIFGQGQTFFESSKEDVQAKCNKKIVYQYHFVLDYLQIWSENKKSVSNLTPNEYSAMITGSSSSNTTTIFHAYAFDAVWGIALALNERERLLDRSEKLVIPEFFGITGPFKISKGERNCLVNVRQYINGNYNYIGYFNDIEDDLHLMNDTLIWPHGQIPSDRSKIVRKWKSINIIIYVIFIAITSCGIVFAFILMGINIKFRKHRYIKMSSPNMNNIIIIGSVLSYVSVIILGTSRTIVGESKFAMRVICSMKAWTLCLGFTLSFGAMFSKTWRVHQIFTNISLNKKVIRDSKLIGMVCFLLLLDVVILSLQTIIDPVQLKIQNSTEISIELNIEIIYFWEFCSSEKQSIWVGVIYAHKGLLLAIGCFLVWETRQVNIPALNDSKHIGLSVYMVVIMCASGAAVNAVIQDSIDFNFIIIASFIILSTTITLSLVFLPKLIQIKNDPKGISKRKQATVRKSSKYSNECSKAQSVHTETIIKGLLMKRLAEKEKIKSDLEQSISEIRKKNLKKKNSFSNVLLNLRKSSTISIAKSSDQHSDNSSKPSNTFVNHKAVDKDNGQDGCKRNSIQQ